MATPERDHEIVRFFMQHVVALNVAFDGRDGNQQADAYTCFVLEIRGEWFLVTAGHTLKDLYSALPSRTGVQCSLFDGWRLGASYFPIPFDLLGASHFLTDEDGLDLGLIHVQQFYRRGLEANGTRAFGEAAWRDPPEDAEKYALIGLPDQFITREATAHGTVIVRVKPTLVFLRAVRPPADMNRPFPCFYGALPDHLYNPISGASLEGMTGFSGGPILAFKSDRDGHAKYFLVAVQGAWRPDYRVVVGALMRVVGRALDNAMQRASTELARSPR
jgi:hypothetical protein